MRQYRRLAESAELHARGAAGFFTDPELSITLAWRDRESPNAAWAERYDLLRSPELEAALDGRREENQPNESWASQHQSGFGPAMDFLAKSERAARRRAPRVHRRGGRPGRASRRLRRARPPRLAVAKRGAAPAQRRGDSFEGCDAPRAHRDGERPCGHVARFGAASQPRGVPDETELRLAEERRAVARAGGGRAAPADPANARADRGAGRQSGREHRGDCRSPGPRPKMGCAFAQTKRTDPRRRECGLPHADESSERRLQSRRQAPRGGHRREADALGPRGPRRVADRSRSPSDRR